MTEQQTFTVPDSWSEVTVAQYEQIDFSDTIGMISILLKCDRDIVEHMTGKGVGELLDALSFVHRDPAFDLVTEVSGYRLRTDIDQLTVDELTMIQDLCEEFQKNSSKIIGFVYRGDEDLLAASVKRRGDLLKHVVTVDQLLALSLHSILTAGILIAPEGSDLKKLTT